jgi:antitoxin MazE
MRSAVGKWGNSLALRLPRAIAAELELHEGSPVELRADNGALIVRPARPRYRLADLLAQTNGESLQAEVDWGEPQGDGAW